MTKMGGYRNESKLTEEHLKLPVEMQRRVGQWVRVIYITDSFFVYRNCLAKTTHAYSLVDGEWVYEGN